MLKVDISTENGGEIIALVFLNHTKPTLRINKYSKSCNFMYSVCEGPIKGHFYGIYHCVLRKEYKFPEDINYTFV